MSIYHDILVRIDALSIEEKEKLIKYLQNSITVEKAMPEKSYLEEKWDDIQRCITELSYEPYIDDQYEIEEVWEIVEDLIKSNKLNEESWEVRCNILYHIIMNGFYDYYWLSDPMEDLFHALYFNDEEKLQCADMTFEYNDDYVRKKGIKLYKELGRMDKYIDYLEQKLTNIQKDYLEFIDYYKDKDISKAREIAELGMKKCKDDQTDLFIFMIEQAILDNDTEKVKKLKKSSQARRLVNYEKVMKSIL